MTTTLSLQLCRVIHQRDGGLFGNSNFENTYDSSILFYFCTGSTGTPVESQQHLRLTMADNPLSVALPHSSPTVACFTNTGIKDVSTNAENTKIGQEMTEFMSSIDSFDQDRITPCFDSNPSPTLPFEEGRHESGIKEAPLPKRTTKNGPKLTAFLMVDDPTSQDDTTLLSAAHFDNGWSPIAQIAACTKDIGIEDVPMTEKNTRKGQKLTNFLLDNPFNDSNKFTMVSDAHFDSVPMPTLPNAACGIKTNTKNASMDRNAFKNGQKMMDSTTDDNPTKSTNNTPFFQNLLTLTWMISPCLHPVT